MWGVTLEEEYAKNPELKAEYIQEVREWLNIQKHLPEIDDLEIVMFLKACEWDVQVTKNTLDLYYTHRTNMPEYFSNRDPKSSELQSISQILHVTVLPQPDPDGNRVLWGRLVDNDASKYSFTSAAKYFVMTSEVYQLKHGTFPGIVLVYDVEHFTFSHLVKTTMPITKYADYAQDSASFPVKAIHYINVNTVLDKLKKLAKPFLRSRLLEVLHLHPNPETLFEHLPKKIVPKDYGGDELTLGELNDLNMENLINYRQWFLDEEKKRVDESKRASKKKSDKSESKLLPSFKKLELD